jgi:hypothetical protein
MGSVWLAERADGTLCGGRLNRRAWRGLRVSVSMARASATSAREHPTSNASTTRASMKMVAVHRDGAHQWKPIDVYCRDHVLDLGHD